MSEPRRLAVLLSGRGSNFVQIARNIQAGRLRNARIDLVISNRPSAAGLQSAQELGLDTAVYSRKSFASAQECEDAMAAELERRGIDLIILAGYMRILGEHFVRRFENRILNIHPSLLPSFVGLDAQAQALEYGVRISGCTVHLVTAELDSGPILVQRSVPVLDDDSVESLSERILEQEHQAYSQAIDRFINHSWHIEGRRVCFES